MLKYNTDVIVEALSRTPGSTPKDNDTNQTEGEASSNNNLLMYGILGLLFLGGFFFVYRNMNK